MKLYNQYNQKNQVKEEIHGGSGEGAICSLKLVQTKFNLGLSASVYLCIMEAGVWTFFGATIGAFLGAGASIFVARTSFRNNLLLEEKKVNYARDTKNRDFQKDNLLQVQEILHNAMRLTILINHHDLLNFKYNKKFRPSEKSEELHQELMISKRELFVKLERISDDSLRIKIQNFITEMSNLIMVLEPTEVKQLEVELSDLYFSLTPIIGSAIRAL